MSNLLAETPGLIAFVRSAETGSFSSAARSLESTPSAVSRSVARLEQRLGARLFLRSTRALTLTPDGQALFDRVSPLLKDLDNAGDVLATGLSGRLKLSLPNELARFLVNPILEKLAKPNPSLRLEVGLSDRFVDVIRDDYDVVIRVGQLHPSELTARKLADMPMIMVASPEYLTRHGVPTTLDEIAVLPFARYVASRAPFEIKFVDGSSIQPPSSIDFDSGYGLHQAALLGVGAAYLMECVVADDIRSGTLVKIAPELALPHLPLHAVHALGRNPSKKVTALYSLIADEIESIARQ